MTQQFYVQTDAENRITDVISYEHTGYIPVMLEVPLPVGILGGAYALIKDKPVYKAEWDNQSRIGEEENI